MARDIEIIVDERKLQGIERMLAGIPRALPKVVTRALNKTAVSARTRVLKTSSRAAKIAQTMLRRRIGLRRASYRRWAATIWIGGRSFPLSAWNVRWKQTWAGAKHKLPSQFAPQLKAGKAFLPLPPESPLPGAFAWRGRAFMRLPGAKRLPIGQIFGPSPAELFENLPGLAATTLFEANRGLEKEIDRQVSVLLEKGR